MQTMISFAALIGHTIPNRLWPPCWPKACPVRFIVACLALNSCFLTCLLAWLWSCFHLSQTFSVFRATLPLPPLNEQSKRPECPNRSNMETLTRLSERDGLGGPRSFFLGLLSSRMGLKGSKSIYMYIYSFKKDQTNPLKLRV